MMKKPGIFIIGSVLLGLVGAGTYLFFSKNFSSSNSSDIAGFAGTPTVAPKLLTWDDPAGFTIQYPEGLSVNSHDEDRTNYAHVELTTATHPGGIIIWVKDLTKGVTDTVSWRKTAATSSSAISFDTTLGGRPAQKILVSAPLKTVTVGVVYDGVLWSIEGTLADEAYWQTVYDSVVQSFIFKPLPTQAANDGASEDVVDEEEVLQ